MSKNRPEATKHIVSGATLISINLPIPLLTMVSARRF